MKLQEMLEREQVENGGKKLTLRQWAAIYENITHSGCNYETLRKRRAVSGAGTLVPPRVYILDAAEFMDVLRSPLPLCTKGMVEA